MIRADHRPLYLQVIDRLKEDIERNVYEEGEKLPSEFELSKLLGVSRATLREALRLLEEEGVVIRRHGVGTFVHSKPLFSAGIEELDSVTDMIVKAKMNPGTIFLSSAVQDATEEDKRKFANDQLTEIMEIERVRTADDSPVVYCLDRIPNELVKHHSIHETKSIFRFLEDIGRTITYAITYVEPIGYHEHVSDILECEPGASLLLLKQMHYDQAEQPVLYSLNYFRADKFKFHVVRKRN
ncbi:GntR family transcriptional regulator [Alkalihalobacillus sp. MEB130]|uniref:GntR family transcriptional regulator n=1 Tax=Alkalihalobacillus sp. MEB130 TaxID=2976704 RepID=UPI0028E06C71|nr:GntR family transcriptional regulator [Alkalihalobacillus sp. MEB130]MDT8858966.1 GntR family transcriptional regulator [Alkalihalobacillus sp. MEB130]